MYYIIEYFTFLDADNISSRTTHESVVACFSILLQQAKYYISLN